MYERGPKRPVQTGPDSASKAHLWAKSGPDLYPYGLHGGFLKALPRPRHLASLGAGVRICTDAAAPSWTSRP